MPGCVQLAQSSAHLKIPVLQGSSAGGWKPGRSTWRHTSHVCTSSCITSQIPQNPNTSSDRTKEDNQMRADRSIDPEGENERDRPPGRGRAGWARRGGCSRCRCQRARPRPFPPCPASRTAPGGPPQPPPSLARRWQIKAALALCPSRLAARWYACRRLARRVHRGVWEMGFWAAGVGDCPAGAWSPGGVRRRVDDGVSCGPIKLARSDLIKWLIGRANFFDLLLEC